MQKIGSVKHQHLISSSLHGADKRGVHLTRGVGVFVLLGTCSYHCFQRARCSYSDVMLLCPDGGIDSNVPMSECLKPSRLVMTHSAAHEWRCAR